MFAIPDKGSSHLRLGVVQNHLDQVLAEEAVADKAHASFARDGGCGWGFLLLRRRRRRQVLLEESELRLGELRASHSDSVEPRASASECVAVLETK